MVPKLTASGKNLLLRALAGETITFTKIQLGNGTAQDPAEATGLANPIITVELSKIVVGTEYVTLTAQFSNSSITSGFHITEAGFFATDPDDSTKEILYALGNEDESSADYVPDKGNRIFEMQLDALIFIGDAENVTAAINSSLVYVSKDEFDSHVNNQNNPHAVTKAQVGLGNVPNVSTNDQTPTFTEAATLESINSGEKMSKILGKVKLSITNLIGHINSKSNPHNCTASQVGAAAKSHTHAATDINAGILSGHRGGLGISAPDYGTLIIGYDETKLQAINWSGALYSQGQNQPKSGVLPIEYGGTGGATPTEAREQLGFVQKTLWSGASQMPFEYTIPLLLDKKISQQANGIVLVFSRSFNGEADDAYFTSIFVPKILISLQPQKLHNFTLYSGSIVSNKILNISDSSISGAAANVTENNSQFFLRYVIGV